jgi:hypothetical protein
MKSILLVLALCVVSFNVCADTIIIVNPDGTHTVCTRMTGGVIVCN